ncbi:hypothetical protein [Mycobacterium sp.]|uniref:hypothetical protein n=1 Tax=Mycobacterium sp. TaxID=1785 RepID=UPI003F99612F
MKQQQLSMEYVARGRVSSSDDGGSANMIARPIRRRRLGRGTEVRIRTLGFAVESSGSAIGLAAGFRDRGDRRIGEITVAPGGSRSQLKKAYGMYNNQKLPLIGVKSN